MRSYLAQISASALFALVRNQHLNFCACGQFSTELGRDGDGVFAEITSVIDIGKMQCGDFFHPHRLPNAGDTRVPNAAALEFLFAVKLVALGGVIDAQDKVIFFTGEKFGDVEGKWCVSADVGADFFAIHKHGGLVVDGFEVQQTALAPTGLGELAFVPESFVGFDQSTHARESRLRAKWHKNAAIPCFGGGGILGRDSVLPEAVEIFP